MITLNSAIRTLFRVVKGIQNILFPDTNVNNKKIFRINLVDFFKNCCKIQLLTGRLTYKGKQNFVDFGQLCKKPEKNIIDTI